MSFCWIIAEKILLNLLYIKCLSFILSYNLMHIDLKWCLYHDAKVNYLNNNHIISFVKSNSFGINDIS